MNTVPLRPISCTQVVLIGKYSAINGTTYNFKYINVIGNLMNLILNFLTLINKNLINKYL